MQRTGFLELNSTGEGQMHRAINCKKKRKGVKENEEIYV